jgi:succinyl-CoA synthetase beta subunit
MAAAESLGWNVVLKAQVLSGGRGKAGGVKFASSAGQVKQAVHDIFSMRLNGILVKRVLVVEVLHIEREFYIGVTIDGGTRSVQVVLSAAGGTDIESVSQSAPEKIVVLPAAQFLHAHDGEEDGALMRVFGNKDAAAMAAGAIASMVRLLYENDCSLVEVNPYVLTRDNKLAAADAKIVIDDNALYKHPGIEALRNGEEYSGEELAAQRAGLSFVGLGGTIGCMVNGAGLAMATMDLIQAFGGRPANFLDVGGSSDPQKVLDAFKILLANKNLKVILVNIFGGITRCDDIASGIILAKQQLGTALPVVVRLAGTNQDRGRELLAGAGIIAQPEMAAAVQNAVALEKAAP